MDLPVVIPLTLLALGIGVVGSLLRPRWDVALLTGLLAAVWSRVNGPVEGAVLHTWTEGRGFTEADVVSVVAVLVALLALARCAGRLVRPGRPGAGATPSAPVGHQGP